MAFRLNNIDEALSLAYGRNKIKNNIYFKCYPTIADRLESWEWSDLYEYIRDKK